jgi:hypothetical protein
MKRQQIKPQRYQAATTCNGYAVYDSSSKTPTTPLYFAAYRPRRDDNVDIEVAFKNIAAWLNVIDNANMDESTIAGAQAQLAKYNQFKVV